MWRLVFEDGDTPGFPLPAGKYMLGRRATAVSQAEEGVSFIDVAQLINNEAINAKSISRKHAEITVLDLDLKDAFSDQVQKIYIKDASKYGVHIPGLQDKWYKQHSLSQVGASGNHLPKIKKNENVPLHDGCELHLSTVDPNLETSTKVKATCARLGICISQRWTSKCQLLVMTELMVTSKVLLALIDQREIVTPAFLDTQQLRQRDPADFIPPLSPMVPENYASHLDDGVTLRNPARQSLFRGLNFTIIQPEPTPSSWESGKQIIEHAHGHARIESLGRVNPQRAGPEEIFVLGSDAGVPESEIVAFKRLVRAAGGRCVTPDQLWESVIFGELDSLFNEGANEHTNDEEGGALKLAAHQDREMQVGAGRTDYAAEMVTLKKRRGNAMRDMIDEGAPEQTIKDNQTLSSRGSAKTTSASAAGASPVKRNRENGRHSEHVQSAARAASDIDDEWMAAKSGRQHVGKGVRQTSATALMRTGRGGDGGTAVVNFKRFKRKAPEVREQPRHPGFKTWPPLPEKPAASQRPSQRRRRDAQGENGDE